MKYLRRHSAYVVTAYHSGGGRLGTDTGRRLEGSVIVASVSDISDLGMRLIRCTGDGTRCGGTKGERGARKGKEGRKEGKS